MRKSKNEYKIVLDHPDISVLIIDGKETQTKVFFDSIHLDKVKSKTWRVLRDRVVDSTNTITLFYFIHDTNRTESFPVFRSNNTNDLRQCNLRCIKRNTYIIDGNIVKLEIRSDESKIDNPDIAYFNIDQLEKVSQYVWHVWQGYACTNKKTDTGRTNLKMHRLIIGEDNIPDNMDIDHIDRVRLNNITDNLRIASASENARNRSCVNTQTNKNGVYRSVVKNRSPRWVACFPDPENPDVYKQRYFSESVYGAEEAERMARELRNEMEQLLGGFSGE